MAQISLCVDDEVKRNAERIFDDIGLSMSTAINIFLKTVADIKAGRNMAEHELIEVE